MKPIYYALVFLAILPISSCIKTSTHLDTNTSSTNNELLNFAKANCFFWYFKKMDYDLKDIGSITGGIVETGTLSAEKYRNAAFLVRDYQPSIATKNNIDIDLLKCFKLENDKDFLRALEDL